MLSEYGLLIWKVITIILHTISILGVLHLARSHFRHDVDKIQLLGIILVTNNNLQVNHQGLYNDDLLGFYAILAIYFLTVDKPLLSVLSLSLGALKAGIILLLPTVLGMIQYIYGTSKLV
jgi:predicted membrane-bound dolichyl-phosphate-mannose-protein mannosyltransferase